jgi:DNA-binding IclR family transcriptional regulator
MASKIPKRQGDPQFANTLERGLRVLQCFSADRPVLGNGDLAQLTGLPKPTVSRLAHTLVSLGYLRHDVGSAKFEVGTSALCLGYPVLARLTFRRAAAGHLQALAADVGGSVVIAVRDRLRMVTLESATVDDVLLRRPSAGATLPLVGTVAGLGWLAGASEAEVERMFREIAHDAPGDVDRVRSDREDGRRQMIKHGFVCRRATLRPGTTAVSTPLARRPGGELLVLSCALNAIASKVEVQERHAGERLLATAKAISKSLLGR